MSTVTITIQDQDDSSITIDIDSKNPDWPDFDSLKDGEEASTTYAQAMGLILYSHAQDILGGENE